MDTGLAALVMSVMVTKLILANDFVMNNGLDVIIEFAMVMELVMTNESTVTAFGLFIALVMNI